MTQTLDLATRFVEQFLGRGDAATARELCHPDIRVISGLKPTGPIEGLEAYLETFAAFGAAFGDWSALTIVDSFATEDRAMIRFQASATHRGAYFGVEPTGRRILFDETHVMRWQDGRLVENVVSATNLEFEMLIAPVLAPMLLP